MMLHKNQSILYIKISQYFHKPDTLFEGHINVKVDSSN